VDRTGAVTLDEAALRAAIADSVPPGTTGQYELMTKGLDLGFISDRRGPVVPWSALTTPDVYSQFDAQLWSYLGFLPQNGAAIGGLRQPGILRAPVKPFAGQKSVPALVRTTENIAMLQTAAVVATQNAPVRSKPLDASFWSLDPARAAAVIVQTQTTPANGDVGTTSTGQALSPDDFADVPGCLQSGIVGWDNPFLLRLCFDRACGQRLQSLLGAVIGQVVSDPKAALGALLTAGITAAVGALGGWVSLFIALSAAYWAVMIWAMMTPNGVCLHIPMPWTFGVIGPGWATGR
jgi:hypothetical protein